MNIQTADFVCSNTEIKKLPAPDRPEYAFIGRSNVGKSSLINMLVTRKGLAKTSQQPGKTRLINHFIINNSWYIVDLPGYGYARVSKTEIAKWEKFIKSYLTKRESLQCVFVLIDSRIPPQRIDIEFVNFLGEIGLPFVLVFTKADKQSSQKTHTNIELFKQEMLKSWDELPQIFVTSSETQLGKEELLNFIEQVNQNFTAPNKG